MLGIRMGLRMSAIGCSWHRDLQDQAFPLLFGPIWGQCLLQWKTVSPVACCRYSIAWRVRTFLKHWSETRRCSGSRLRMRLLRILILVPRWLLHFLCSMILLYRWQSRQWRCYCINSFGGTPLNISARKAVAYEHLGYNLPILFTASLRLCLGVHL